MSTDLFNNIEQWLPPRRSQFLTICYVGVIYATLPVMRPILNFLKDTLRESFSFSIYVFLCAIALGLIILFLNQRGKWRSCLFLITILTVTAFILPVIKYPEERIHFLEYAVLGIMLYFALREGITGRKVFIGIPVIVFFIGLGDEIIQGILPNRVYQFSDVVLNFCGGILGEFILITFNPGLLKRGKSV